MSNLRNTPLIASKHIFRPNYENLLQKSVLILVPYMISRMFAHYMSHPEDIPEDFQPQLSFDGMERTVCDYIAGMTDKYAVDKFTEIFIPTGWQVRG